MDCKNNLSCTFLDLFLFILNGVENGDFVDHTNITPGIFFHEETQHEKNKFQITPNVFLTINQKKLYFN